MPDNDPTQPAAPYPAGTVPAAGYTAGTAQPTTYQPGAPMAQPAAPAQPVYYQPQPTPVYVPVPVQTRAPAAAAPSPQPSAAFHEKNQDAIEKDQDEAQPEIVLVSHSGLFYWWPVWAFGYLFTLITLWHGQEITVGDTMVRIHQSNNLGILYFLIVFLVILISNVEVRGVASLAVVLTLVVVVLTLAYFRVWDTVLHWFGHLNVYLNQGAYFWFSTLMFVTWALSTFVFDRFTHWVIKPGQVTREHFWGAGSQSYATENMTLEKRRNDLFRHWILGLGSGDLRVHTYGAQHEEIFIPNVLFVGYKIHAVERLIAERPADFGRPTIK